MAAESWRVGPNGENRGYIDLILEKTVMSPSRNPIAVSQPGMLKVIVWGLSGGRECPNSVVIGLTGILKVSWFVN